MHRNYPMAGHVLPAIFSWNLNVEINSVAKNASAALDPVEVWRAWSAGAHASVDTFAPDWDFWAYAARPLKALRETWSIPSAGPQPSNEHIWFFCDGEVGNVILTLFFQALPYNEHNVRYTA